jgi:hypothetical protein
MDTVPTPPESTKTLRQRLRARANERWPQLTDLTIRHHGQFAYIDGQLPDGTTLPLFRLRLRPLPQRPHRLDPTPDELTGVTTSEASLGPPRWAAGLGEIVAVGCWLRSGPSLPSDNRGAAARPSAGQDRFGRPGWRSLLRW